MTLFDESPLELLFIGRFIFLEFSMLLNGVIKHAINTFYDMHLYGCNRTVKSFNAALKVLIQTRD